MRKQMIIKTLALLLVFSLCMSILPSSVFAVSESETAKDITPTLEDFLAGNATAEDIYGVLDESTVPEIIGYEEAVRKNHVRRLYEDEGEELNKVVFLNVDGSKTMYTFDFPVKYIDNNGKIQDITLEIADSTTQNSKFESAANPAMTTFATRFTDGITLSSSDAEIRLVPDLSYVKNEAVTMSSTAMLDNNPSLMAEAQRIDEKTIEYRYDDVTTVEYSLTYTGFKEDIVVSEYTGQTEYPFRLYTNGLSLEEIDGSYFLVDDYGDIRAAIGDIIIFTADERNNTFGEIVPTTIVAKEEYLLTIVVDADYLADPNTTYPIRIDPTVEIDYNDGTSVIEDITITTNTNYTGSHTSLYVGRRSTEGIARALMRFPGLDLTGLEGATVTSASVRMRDLMCEDTPLDISCHVFTGSVWDANSATWSAVSPNSYVSTPLSTNTLSWSIGDTFDPIHWYYFDITSAVQGWANGTYTQNKGIIFKVASSVENGSTIANRTFGSYNRASYKPSFSMTYFDGTSSIALSTTSCSIQEGNTRTLVATTNPAGQAVTWSTSNSAVATVSSSGVVTAKKAGTATITARMVDPNGITRTATCVVYVYIANGVYYIKNMNSNYYLHVDSGHIENYTDVYQYIKYTSTTSEVHRIRQMWKIYHLGNGRYSIRPMNKLDMGLDVTGNNVDIYNIGATDTLSNIPYYGEWSIEWYSTGYVFKNNGSDSQTMQIENASTSSGATVVASAYSTSVNCRWGLTKVSSPPSGIYLYDTSTNSIITTATRYVAPKESRTLSEQSISVISYDGSNISQSFSWTPTNGSFVSVNSSGTITGKSAGTTTITAQKVLSGTTYSVSYTVITTPIANGTYYMQNKQTGYYADIEGPTMASGTTIHQWEYHGGSSQKWIFKHLGDGYYSIKSSNSSSTYYMGVVDDSTALDVDVVLRTGTITNGVKWKIESTVNGAYKIIPKTGVSSGYILATTTSNASNGYKLIQGDYIDNNSYRDEWLINSVTYSINLEPQHQSNWCWAASARMSSQSKTVGAMHQMACKTWRT